MIKFVISSLCLVSIASALNLPNYIKPCKLDDPNLNDCALKQTKLAFPLVSKGDKKIKSPSLIPLFLPLIEVDTGPNLKLKLKDLNVYGLDGVEFKETNFDTKTNKAHLKMSATLNFIGKYEINGKILVLPINGDGNCNITFSGGDFTYDMNWKLFEKNNKQYAQIETHKLDMKLKRTYFQFLNLFNGDKLLGDNMNKVLNDNWEEVMKEVGPGITQTLEVVLHNVVKAYFEHIPYREIFV
ncbi:unnamed protein product [Brassicogethes aeneus]|uniref:Uncharacterized protein n=1 Tax=Brassicogethes aeneus TaxID=1431903 RepID=A0A9P0AVV3_BRAAE|nr:unnamed protein product [Brassicogethes aeneus]